MTVRHFAFFDQETGAWIREWRGPVAAPDFDPALVGETREMALNAWATNVSYPQPGEVGLDVTHANCPVGDFVWARFDAINRRVEWPETHRFLIIDRQSGEIVGHIESDRPVRSNERHIAMEMAPGSEFWSMWGSVAPHMLPQSTSDDLSLVDERAPVYAPVSK